MSDAKLLNLRSEIAEHLEQIADLFTQRPKITIIIRTDWLENGDVTLSDDDASLAIAALRRLEHDAAHVFPADRETETKENYRKYSAVFPSTLCQYKRNYECILVAGHEGGHEMRVGCELPMPPETPNAETEADAAKPASPTRTGQP